MLRRLVHVVELSPRDHLWISPLLLIGTLSKWGRQRQQWEAKKIFLCNPYILLRISLLWLPCMFLFSLKFRWLQHLLLNETMDISSWNVGHVLKTAWKWSSWSLIWEQDGTNVSFISHIHVRFLSSVIMSYCFANVAVAILSCFALPSVLVALLWTLSNQFQPNLTRH